MITWDQYCACLRLLEKRFGKLSQIEVQSGFNYWKSKEQSDLMVEVDCALQTGQRPNLAKPRTIKKPPYFKPAEPEKLILTDDFMDQMLKKEGVSSLFDLVMRQKKERA